MSDPLIEAKGLRVSYNTFPVLDDLNLKIAEGEGIAIIGPSGSGKTTLLHLLAGLASPHKGLVHFMGEDLSKLGENAVSRLRNEQMGFLYQQSHLMSAFTSLDNLSLPLLMRGYTKVAARQQAHAMLQRLQLEHLAQASAPNLSLGERQRVALGRALIGEPKVLIMDEPTGSLDAESAEWIGEMLTELIQAGQMAIVLATHDQRLAKRMNKQWRLEGGSLELA